MLVTDGDVPKDTEKLALEESEVVPRKDQSQDIGVTETKVGQFTLEGDTEYSKISRISVAERSEILVSKKREESLPDGTEKAKDSEAFVRGEAEVSLSSSEISDDWEMVESDTEIPKDDTDSKPSQSEQSIDKQQSKDKSPEKEKSEKIKSKDLDTESDAELSKDKELQKAKEVLETSEEDLVVIEVPEDAFKDETTSDELKISEATEVTPVSDIELKAQDSVKKDITDKPSVPTEIQEEVDDKDFDMAEEIFAEDLSPDVIKTSEKEMQEVDGAEADTKEPSKDEEQKQITQEKRKKKKRKRKGRKPAEHEKEEEIPSVTEVEASGQDSKQISIDQDSLEEDWKPDEIKIKPEEEKIVSSDKDISGPPSEVEKEADVQGERKGDRDEGSYDTQEEQSPDSITVKVITPVLGEDKYQEHFAEDWLPDVIETGKTEEEKTKGKETTSESDADLFEDATPEVGPQEIKPIEELKELDTTDDVKIKETERGEEFLYIERHERISKVFTDKTSTVTAVAELDQAQDIVKPEKIGEEEKDKDIIKSTEKELTSGSDVDQYEDATPEQAGDKSEPTVEEPHVPVPTWTDADEGKLRELAAGEYTAEDDIHKKYLDEDWSPDAVPQKPSKDEREIPVKPIESGDLDIDVAKPGKDRKEEPKPVLSEPGSQILTLPSERKKTFRQDIAGESAAEETIYEDHMQEDWSPDTIPQKLAADEEEVTVTKDQPLEPGMETVDIVEPAKDKIEAEEFERDQETVEPGELTEDDKLRRPLRESLAGEETIQGDIYEEYMEEDWTPDAIPEKPGVKEIEKSEKPGQPGTTVTDIHKHDTDRVKYEKTDKYAQDIQYLPDGTTMVLEESHEDISQVIIDDTVVTVVEQDDVTKDDTGTELIGENQKGEELEKEDKPAESSSRLIKREQGDNLREHAPGEYTTEEGIYEDFMEEEWTPDVIPQKPGDEKERPEPEQPGESVVTEVREHLTGEYTAEGDIYEEYMEEDWSPDVIPQKPAVDGDKPIEPDTEATDIAERAKDETEPEKKLEEEPEREQEVVEPDEVVEEDKRKKPLREHLAGEYTTEDDIYEEYIEEDWSPDLMPQKPAVDVDKPIEPDTKTANIVDRAKDETEPEKKLEEGETVEPGELVEDNEREKPLREHLASEYTTEGDIYEEYMEADWSPDVIPQKPGSDEATEDQPVEPGMEADMVDMVESAKDTTEKKAEEEPGQEHETVEPGELADDDKSRKPLREQPASEYTAKGNIYEEYMEEGWSPDVIPHTPREEEERSTLERSEEPKTLVTVEPDKYKEQEPEEKVTDIVQPAEPPKSDLTKDEAGDAIPRKPGKKRRKRKSRRKSDQSPESELMESQEPKPDTAEREKSFKERETLPSETHVADVEPDLREREKPEKEYLPHEDTLEEGIYDDDYVPEDWSPDRIPQKMDTKEEHEDISQVIIDDTVVIVEQYDVTKDDAVTETDQQGRELTKVDKLTDREQKDKLREHAPGEYTTDEGIYGDYMEEQWTPDVIPQKPGDEKERFESAELDEESADTKPVIDEKEAGKTEPEAVEPDDRRKKPLRKHLAGEYTAEGDIYEEYMEEDWSPDVIQQKPGDLKERSQPDERDITEAEKLEEPDKTIEGEKETTYILQLSQERDIEDIEEEQSAASSGSEFSGIEASDADSFRDDWSPDVIITGVKEKKESESNRDLFEDAVSETEHKDEDVKPKAQLEDVPTTKQVDREDITYEEKHDRISKIFPDAKASLMEVAEQDFPEYVKSAEDYFREDWSANIIKIAQEEKEELPEGEGKDVKPISSERPEDEVVEPDDMDKRKGKLTVDITTEETELTEVDVDVKTPDRSRFFGVVPSVDNIQLFEISPKPEKLVFHLDEPREETKKITVDEQYKIESSENDTEKDQNKDIIAKEEPTKTKQVDKRAEETDQYCEDYYREWSHDDVKAGSTSESEEFFEDTTVSIPSEESSQGEAVTYTEREEGISEVFPDQKTTLVMVAEQDYFQEEWSPGVIKTGPEESPEESVESSEDDSFKDVTYTDELSRDTVDIKAIADDAKETTVVQPFDKDKPKGTVTVETSTQDVDLTGVSEMDIQESGYFRSLSIEPAVDNVQIYQISPEPEKLTFQFDTTKTDVHVKTMERITEKVDTPESVIEFGPSASETEKTEVDSTEEDVRLELKDKEAERIEKPSTPRGAVGVETLAEDFTLEPPLEEKAKGRVEKIVTDEDAIRKADIDVRVKSEDVSETGIEDQTPVSIQIDETETDIDTKDVSEDRRRGDDTVSDVKPGVDILEEPERHEASDSLGFSTPDDSPRASITIDISVDGTTLTQVDDDGKPKEIPMGAVDTQILPDERRLERIEEDTEEVRETTEVTSDKDKPTGKLQTDITVEEIHFGMIPHEIKDTEKFKPEDDMPVKVSTDLPVGKIAFETQTEDITLTAVKVPDDERERIAVDVEDVQTDITFGEQGKKLTIRMVVDVKTDEVALTDKSEELKIPMGTVYHEIAPEGAHIEEKETILVETDDTRIDVRFEERDEDHEAVPVTVKDKRTDTKLGEVEKPDEAEELSPAEPQGEDVKYEAADKYVQDVEHLPDGTTVVLEENKEGISKVFIHGKDTLEMVAEQDQIVDDDHDKIIKDKEEHKKTGEKDSDKEVSERITTESEDEDAFRDAEGKIEDVTVEEVPEYTTDEDTDKVLVKDKIPDHQKVAKKKWGETPDHDVDEAKEKFPAEKYPDDVSKPKGEDSVRDIDGDQIEKPAQGSDEEIVKDAGGHDEGVVTPDIREGRIPEHQKEGTLEEELRKSEEDRLPEEKAQLKELDERLPGEQDAGVLDIDTQVLEEIPSDHITVVTPAKVTSVTDLTEYTGKVIMRGQYDVEEHPIDITLPVPVSALDGTKGRDDITEHTQDVTFEGDERFVGKFAVDIPVTDTTFDKEVPEPIPVKSETQSEDIELHAPEKDERLPKEEISEDEDPFKDSEPGILEKVVEKAKDTISVVDTLIETYREIEKEHQIEKPKTETPSDKIDTEDLDKDEEKEILTEEIPEEEDKFEDTDDGRVTDKDKGTTPTDKIDSDDLDKERDEEKPKEKNLDDDSFEDTEDRPLTDKGYEADIDKEAKVDKEDRTEGTQYSVEDTSKQVEKEELSDEVEEKAKGQVKERLGLKAEDIDIEKIADRILDEEQHDTKTLEPTEPMKEITKDEEDMFEEVDTEPKVSVEDKPSEYREETAIAKDALYAEQFEDATPAIIFVKETDQDVDTGEEYTGEDILDALSEEEREDQRPIITDKDTKDTMPSEIGTDKITEHVQIISPASVETTTEHVEIPGKLIIRGQYDVEEHPWDIQLPVSRDDAALGHVDVEELTEDAVFKGDKKYVGTFSIDVPVTDSTFDKEVPPPIFVHSESSVVDIELHKLEEDKLDRERDKPTKEKLSDEEDLFKDAEGGILERITEPKATDKLETEEEDIFRDAEGIKTFDKNSARYDEKEMGVTVTDILEDNTLKAKVGQISDKDVDTYDKAAAVSSEVTVEEPSKIEPDRITNVAPAVTEETTTEHIQVISPASVESTTEHVDILAKFIMRGQYDIEEHPWDIQLPVSRDDAALGHADVEELTEDAAFKGDKKYVGTFSVNVPVTDSTFDKEVPPPIIVHSDPNIVDTELHKPEELPKDKLDRERAKPTKEKLSDEEDLFKDARAADKLETEEEDIFRDAEGIKIPDKVSAGDDKTKIGVTVTDIPEDSELKAKVGQISDTGVDTDDKAIVIPSGVTVQEPEKTEEYVPDEDKLNKVVEPSAPPLEDEEEGEELSQVVRSTEEVFKPGDIEEV